MIIIINYRREVWSPRCRLVSSVLSGGTFWKARLYCTVYCTATPHSPVSLQPAESQPAPLSSPVSLLGSRVICGESLQAFSCARASDLSVCLPPLDEPTHRSGPRPRVLVEVMPAQLVVVLAGDRWCAHSMRSDLASREIRALFLGADTAAARSSLGADE